MFIYCQRCEGAPISKASAVATKAASFPMSTAAAESPSEQRRKKTSWQHCTGEVFFCNYDTHLSVHIMKWFDAMCKEPFDAEQNWLCVSEYKVWRIILARKATFLDPQWVRSSFGCAVFSRFVCRTKISCLPVVTLQVQRYQRECLAFAFAYVRLPI